MRLKIISPDGVLVGLDDVVSVTIPSVAGQMTVLNMHEPMLCLLRSGRIFYRRSRPGGRQFVDVTSGFMQTDGREVAILVENLDGHAFER